MVAAITGAAASIVIPSTSSSSLEPQPIPQSSEAISNAPPNHVPSVDEHVATTSEGQSDPMESTSSNIAESERREVTDPQTAAENTPPVSLEGPAEPDVNQADLQRLMDMGFPRERCVEAIRNTSTLDQATDYLLTAQNNPLLNLRSSTSLAGPSTSGTTGPSQAALGGTSTEQDDLMRAIAMSLGENAILSAENADNAGK